MDNIVTYKNEKYNQIGYKDGKAIFENKQRNKYIIAIQNDDKLEVTGTGSTLKEIYKLFK